MKDEKQAIHFWAKLFILSVGILKSYGKCLRVLLCTFLDLDRITVSFNKFYDT